MAKKKKTARKATPQSAKTAAKQSNTSSSKRKTGKANGKADATAVKIVKLAGTVMKAADKRRDPETG